MLEVVHWVPPVAERCIQLVGPISLPAALVRIGMVVQRIVTIWEGYFAVLAWD